MVVDPSEKELLRGQLDQLTDVLARPEEVHQAWDLGDRDPLEEEHLDELPDQPEHQPLLTLARVECVTVNTNDDTTDGFGRIDGKCQVLVLLKKTLFTLYIVF